MKKIKRFFRENAPELLIFWLVAFGVTGFISCAWRIDWLFELLTMVTALGTLSWFIGTLVFLYHDKIEYEATN